MVEAVDTDKKTYKYVDLVYRINASAFLKQFQPEDSDPQREEGNPQVSPTIPEGSELQGEDGGSQVSPTLNDYLDWRRKQGEKAQPIVVFLPQSATLADADAKLKATTGCRDVIVTTDGKETSPVVVYVTDVDINEYK